MKVYVPIFDQYEDIVSIDKENKTVTTLFKGHLENTYDLDDVEFVEIGGSHEQIREY